MTSIKNDAYLVGAGAVGAAGANVLAQNKAAIKRVAAPIAGAAKKAVTSTDPYVTAGKAVKNAAKKSVKGKTYTKAAKKAARSIKKGYKATKKAVKNGANTVWKNVVSFFKNTSWKTAGKYAIAGAVVAAVATGIYKLVNRNSEE